MRPSRFSLIGGGPVTAYLIAGVSGTLVALTTATLLLFFIAIRETGVAVAAFLDVVRRRSRRQGGSQVRQRPPS